MTITDPPTPHYPTLVPVAIADLELILGTVEIALDIDPAEAAAAGRLRTILAAAIAAQAAARFQHPALDIDPAAEAAGNVTALPVAMHAGGHVTEAVAARRVEVTAGSKRATVLAQLARNPRGLTDYELEDQLGWDHLAGAKRRTELAGIGLVTASLDPATHVTRTRPTPRGNPATVWQVTDLGLEALTRLGYHWRDIAGALDHTGRIVTAPTASR